MQHFNKYGFAALMFFLGTALPAVAQDDVQEEVDTEVAARENKKIKPSKSYPTIDVKGKVVVLADYGAFVEVIPGGQSMGAQTMWW